MNYTSSIVTRVSQHCIAIFRYLSSLASFIMIHFTETPPPVVLLYHDYCVCVKIETLCNCLSSSFSCDSASLIQNIKEFGAVSYLPNYGTTNRIQLFVSIKGKFLGSILFQNKTQQSGIL